MIVSAHAADIYRLITAADCADAVAAGYFAIIIKSAHAADFIPAADCAGVVAAGYCVVIIRSAHAADLITGTADCAGVVAAGYCAPIPSAHAADPISTIEI